MAVAFDAVGPAGGLGATTAGAGPLTWAHINSAAGNAILVGVNYRSGTSPEATAVTYGGVSLARIGTVPGNNAGPGGIDLWGKIGSLPTGSNTVSVTFTGGAGNVTTGGSISLTGAATFGTAFTAFASATTVSVNVTGTASGGMIVATASFGNSSAVYTANSPGTQRWSVIGDSNGAADNTVGGTWASPGGTQAVGFSETGAPADFWGLVAVEVQAGAAGSAGGGGGAQPGRTWLRRFHHRQLLPQTPVAPAVVAAVPAPLPRPSFPRRAPQRARVGPAGACAAGIAIATGLAAVPPGTHRPPVPVSRQSPARARVGPMANSPGGGIASQVITPLGTPARPHPFVFRSPLPGRARTGPRAAPAAGIASRIVTPLGFPAVPRSVVPRLAPRRAQVGPRLTSAGGVASTVVTPLGTPGPAWRALPRRPGPSRVLWRGVAGPQPVAVTTVTAYQHAPPPPRSPAPRRALWRGLASQIVTPRGTPGPVWRLQPRRPAPARAVWRGGAGPQPAAVTTVTAYQHAPPPPRSPAPRRALWRGYGSPVVTPLGTPTARRPVFTAPGRRTRATIGHGQVAGGIAGPPAVAPSAPQAYQHPRPLPRSTAPRRGLWRGGAGPQPVAAPTVIRLPRQPRSAPPRRALWRGLASRIVTPLGIPSRKPPPPANTPRKRQRALWRGGAGPPPPPPSGLLAGTTAGPPQGRWAASLPVDRWAALPAASRWQAALPAPRYDAGNPESRWQAGPPVKGRYSVRVITGSVEYIQFPVTGPPGEDVTTFPLECAIVTEAHGEPPPGDPAWTAGLWLNGLASALIDETVLGNGDYVVFGRLTATPEKPVVRSGRVRLGPAS